MKISILVEGTTERVFQPFLRKYLEQQLVRQSMPRLDFVPQSGAIPMGEKLRRIVENLLNYGQHKADAVIALTDVYTGRNDFTDAQDAKRKLTQWAGQNPKFYPHVALYDFEAWLLPYWAKVQNLTKNNRSAPASNPETVNHNRPPSYHLQEVFRTGTGKKSYSKVIDTPRILSGEDLSIAINACAELKAFVNRILVLSGGQPIP